MHGSFVSPVSKQDVAEAMVLHLPVLLHEALAGLGVGVDGRAPEGVYIDGTFGRGGHCGALLQALQGRGMVHAIDQDPEAEAAASAFQPLPNFRFHRANFAEIRQIAEREDVVGRVRGLLLDLGVSSPQLDDAHRGFSFSHDGPLDMRMNPSAGESAAEWLARADAESIAEVLFTYGEERNSRRIAQRIVHSRTEVPITRTAQLAALIASVPGPRSKTIHPATRSFQAIRIHINAELDVLKAVLADSYALLAPGGRLAVISFHSLEDRIVKQFLRQAGAGRRASVNKYAHLAPQAEADAGDDAACAWREVGRYLPTEAEAHANPRARSAVLRVAEKLGGMSQ
jgi:16S rRNA (cytosine1402-N4)-methyltransferase